MKSLPHIPRHLTISALAILALLAIAAFLYPRPAAPTASALARPDAADVEAARLAFEQAKEHEFGLEATSQDQAAVHNAAIAADAALKAYNDAVAASQGNLPLVTPPPEFTDEQENNNPLTGGTPQFLDVNPATKPCAIVDGAINPDGDIDVYRINVPTGTRAWVYVDTGGATNPGSESRNSTLRIFRSDATTIETDFDDGTGNGLDLTTETELSSAIGGAVLSGSPDNNYFIEINEFLFNQVIDPYRLFVVVTNTTPTPESDTTNNSNTTPDVLVASGQTLGLRSGTASSDTLHDWYSIQGVQAGDIIYINLDAINGRNHVIDFFLPGNLTTTPDFTANSAGIGLLAETPAESFAFLAQTSGTYLLRVRRVPVVVIIRIDFGAGSYDLMASLCRFADLSITKTDSPDPVIAGNLLTYTLEATNNGPSNAQNVRIDDVIPANTTFVNVSFPNADGVPSSSINMDGTTTVSGLFAGATLPGSKRVMVLTVRVCPEAGCGTIISNTATTTSDTEDLDTSDNSDTETTTVNSQADLTISKSVSPQPVVAGCTVTFTILVTNTGPSNATGTIVVDNLPPGLTVMSIGTSQGSSSGVGTATATINVGTLGAPNQCSMTPVATSATITIVAQVPLNQPPGTLTNTASVSRNVCANLADPGNNTATSQFDVFDVTLQDETSPNRVLIFRSDTGDYIFCCGTTKVCGVGIVRKMGQTITLDHTAADRRVTAKVEKSIKKGTASLKQVVGLTCSITDMNILNNTACTCTTCPHVRF